MQSPDTPTSASTRTNLQRVLEGTGIVAFFVLAGWAIVGITRTAQAAHIDYAWLFAASAVFCSLLAADFFSGFVHWAADNWGDPKWPVLGPGFIQPFRHHHVDPQDITRHGFVELNGNNCIVSLPVFWLATYASDSMPGAAGLFWGTFCVGVAFWVFGTNQFHSWAHDDAPPRLVRLLQKAGLILSPRHHDVHHIAPHHRNYCITNGWMDTPLSWLRFFPIIEWVIARITGVRPQHVINVDAAAARETARA
jgi:plasmanylethanolamine desaturase